MVTENKDHQISYHFVFSTRYRTELSNPVREVVKEVLDTTIAARDWTPIKESLINSSDMHIYISTSAEIAPITVVKILKGTLTKRIFDKFPALRSKFKGGLFDERSYICASGRCSDFDINEFLNSLDTHDGRERS